MGEGRDAPHGHGIYGKLKMCSVCIVYYKLERKSHLFNSKNV